MEFEIEEWAVDAWLIDQGDAGAPNHVPGWLADNEGHAQTGVWIPEEGRAISAKRVLSTE